MSTARHRELGVQLRTARLEAQLTIRQLAAAAGMGSSSLHRLEMGEVDKLDVTDLSRLAEALNLPLASVLDAAGIPLHRNLPNLDTYLRERYPELPEAALAEMQQHVEQISRVYQGGGPAGNEDEL